MSTKRRKVRQRSSQINLTKGKLKRARPTRAMLIETARKLNRTRTRRFILYALLCVLLMQFVRFIIYEFIYVGSQTPSGIAFTLIIYVQTGLMLASLGFLVAASIAYLNSLRD